MFIVFITTPLPVRSSELWGQGGLAGFCEKLQNLDTTVFNSVFKQYLPVIEQEGIDFGQVKLVTDKDVMPLLSQAIKLGLGPLELFSDLEFAKTKSCALLLDQKALIEVNKKFDIHGLWMISAPVQGDKNISMEFLLLGQGKLIVGYPKSATVTVKDYDLYTGNYSYEPLISMNIVNDRNTRGLLKIKTFNILNNKWLPFKGPLNADINSLEVEDEYIRVKYVKVTQLIEKIRKIPISYR